MTSTHRRTRPWGSPLLMLVVMCGISNAQDIEEEELAPAPVQRQFIWPDETFDQWVLGNRSANVIRTRFVSVLTLQVDEVDRACDLSKAQRKKLELAGRGDIKHFFDRVEEKKRKFRLVKNDQNKFQAIIQEAQPLQMAINSGLFDEESIFSRTIAKTLDKAQAARFEKVRAEKARLRYRARIDLVIANLDNAIGFRADQRTRLAELILRETKPPTKYGQYDYYIVMYQASRLPEASIRPIFDEARWKLLKNQLDNMRGMESFLKSNGMLPKNEGDAEVEDARATTKKL